MERIPVRFEGLGADSEELSWGQRAIWNAMVAQRSWLPITLVRAVPAGTTVEDVRAELRYCLARYASLRTRLRFDSAGEPRQVVAGDGELDLLVVEAGGADPAVVAARLERQLSDDEFDFSRDWPVRTALVRSDGVASHVVGVYCHLALDGAARLALQADLATRDPAPLAAMTPAELARWERTEPAQRTSAAAMRYWEQLLRQLPARGLAAAIGDGDEPAAGHPRYWRGEFRSRALHLALSAIDRQARAGTAALLAVFAIALARTTGLSPVVAQVVVGNRFRTQLARVFAPVNQAGLWAVDVAGASFAQVLSQARRRAMSAYKNAYYDPRARDELLARIGRERGEEVELGCVVNDRRLTAQSEPAGDPSAEQLREALAQTTLAWLVRGDTPGEALSISAEDDPETLRLTVSIDTQVIAPAAAEAMLREMEVVALAAFADPAAPTGIGDGARPGQLAVA